jgi:hypothetical protein
LGPFPFFVCFGGVLGIDGALNAQIISTNNLNMDKFLNNFEKVKIWNMEYVIIL